MDIAGKARKLERRISRTVDAAVGGVRRPKHDGADGNRACGPRPRRSRDSGHRTRPPRVSVQSRPGPRGCGSRRQGSPRAIRAVIDGPPSLSGSPVRTPSFGGLRRRQSIRTFGYVRRRGSDWPDADFHVEFDRAVPARWPSSCRRVENPTRRLKLTVVKGAAEHRAYAFRGGRIDIGRQPRSSISASG